MVPDFLLAAHLPDALCRVLREARETAAWPPGGVVRRQGLKRQAISFIEQNGRRLTAETFAGLTMVPAMQPSVVAARAECRIPDRRLRKASEPAVPSSHKFTTL